MKLVDSIAEARGAEIFEMLERVFDDAEYDIGTDLRHECEALIREINETNEKYLESFKR